MTCNAQVPRGRTQSIPSGHSSSLLVPVVPADPGAAAPAMGTPWCSGAWWGQLPPTLVRVCHQHRAPEKGLEFVLAAGRRLSVGRATPRTIPEKRPPQPDVAAPPRPRAWSSRVTRCHWFRAHCSLLACQTVTVTCDSCSEAVLNKCLPSTASGSEHNAPQRTPCRATRTGVTNHQPVAKKDPRNTCSLILKTMMVEGKN